MTRSDEHPESIERLIDRALREQPLRRAPPALASRVLAEIGRRSARPWWSKSFGHWPLAARAGFMVASYAFVRLTLTGVMWVTSAVRTAQFAEALNPIMTWMRSGAGILSATGEAYASVIRAIPPYWLYGAVICGVALYVALFGLGATAYRTLYRNRS